MTSDLEIGLYIFMLAAFIALRVIRPERATTRYAISAGTLAMMLIAAIATFALLARAPRTSVADRAATTITMPVITLPVVAPELPTEQIDTRGTQTTHLTAVSTLTSWRPAPLGPVASSIVVAIWALPMRRPDAVSPSLWVGTRTVRTCASAPSSTREGSSSSGSGSIGCTTANGDACATPAVA